MLTINTPADAYKAIATIIETHAADKGKPLDDEWAVIDWDNMDTSPSDLLFGSPDLVGPVCPWSDKTFTPDTGRALLRIGAGINNTTPDALLDMFAYKLAITGKPWEAYEAAIECYGSTWFCDPRNMLLNACGDAGVYVTAAKLLGH